LLVNQRTIAWADPGWKFFVDVSFGKRKKPQALACGGEGFTELCSVELTDRRRAL